MSRGVKLPDRYHAITMAFFLAVFAQYENQCTGYEMNKPISGLLICCLRDCPQNITFALKAKYSFLRQYLISLKGYIYQIMTRPQSSNQ